MQFSLHKNPKGLGSKASGLVNMWRFRERGAQRGTEAPCPFLTPCPMQQLHVTVTQLYSLTINW